MNKDQRIAVTPDEIREVLKNWIDDSDGKTIKRIYNENFDEEINYYPATGLYDITINEAERVGLIQD